MRALLVNPEYPTTYWGMQHALALYGKKVALPPLGLVTMAAHLPQSWELRLIDCNAERLTDASLDWADLVLTGGMRVQGDSMHEILRRARGRGRRTAVGGPAPTTAPGEYSAADVVFVGELEGREESLIAALLGESAARVLHPPAGWKAEMRRARVPRFDLLRLGDYGSMSVQFSRGCPYSCEFCDVIEIFGRKPRVKTNDQVFAELEALHRLGYRGTLFFVDDNFIGKKPAVRRLVERLAPWQRARGFPFELYTEASVNLSQDDALMRALVGAGFTAVFVGLETPSEAALAGAGKKQNLKVDLAEAVETLTRQGLEVMGGFIVGFDQDGPDVFDLQERFVAGSPMPLAMVGVLTALPGTALWRRLEREGRLRSKSSGDQFGRPNFEPAMDESTLVRGYARLLARVYDPAAYYRRCRAAITHAPPAPGATRVGLSDLLTAARVIVDAGIRSPWRASFWRYLVGSLTSAPHAAHRIFAHAVKGQHLIRYTREAVLPRLRMGEEARLQPSRRRSRSKKKPRRAIRISPAASIGV